MDIEKPVLLKDPSPGQNSANQNGLTYEAALDILTTQDATSMKLKLHQLPRNHLRALSEYFGVYTVPELLQAITDHKYQIAQNRRERLRHASACFTFWQISQFTDPGSSNPTQAQQKALKYYLDAYWGRGEPCLLSFLSIYLLDEVHLKDETLEDLKNIKLLEPFVQFMSSDYRGQAERQFEKYMRNLDQSYYGYPLTGKRSEKWRQRKPQSPLFIESTLHLIQRLYGILNK